MKTQVRADRNTLETRVMFLECTDPFWPRLALRLEEELGWKVCYWTGADWMEPLVREALPEAVFHHNLMAVRGIPPEECSHLTPAVLDSTLLRALARCETLTLKMMDRMDMFDSFLYRERVQLYHRLVSYWKAVLEEFRPNIALFSEIPHLIYDYVLHELCRLYGVEIIAFEFSTVRGLVFPMGHFEDETPVERRYRELLASWARTEITLSQETEEYLERLRAEKPRAGPQHTPIFQTWGDGQTSRKHRWPVRRLLGWLRATRHNLREIRSQTLPPNYIKLSGLRPDESFISPRGYRALRKKARAYIRELKRQYDSLAAEPDLSVPYIYVALSYQPELTTSPMAGEFVHMELMVSLLARYLPQGWRLYVREHPMTFWPAKAMRSQSGRHTEFYRDLAKIPEVQLVPTELPPFRLIDNARAVATARGTSGWEAVVRGVPSIAFGYPWYRGCEGVFSVFTAEDCRKAIEKVAGGYRVDHRKVRLFVRALEDVACFVYTDPQYKEVVSLSEEENAQRLATTLARYWRGQSVASTTPSRGDSR